jgi:thioredoxin-like negative regulator of GroEL
VAALKRYYSLLEIKDYLLMKRITERCKEASVFVLYFYGNADACEDCDKQSYVLTALREKYPGLRVYSFDYNIDISAVQTLKSIYKVGDALPALVMNGKTFNGFQSVEDIEKNLPELKTLLPEEEKPKVEVKPTTTKSTKKQKVEEPTEPTPETPKEEEPTTPPAGETAGE